MNDLIEIINGKDIARDDYSKYVDSCTFTNLLALNDYYYAKKNYADQLVLEDEFVGITYRNLDIIKKLLVKRR